MLVPEFVPALGLFGDPAFELEAAPCECEPKVGALEFKPLGSFNRETRLAGIGD